MYCASCRYDLRGLEDGRCPECGRSFDPANAASFAASRDPWRKWPLCITAAAAAYPLVMVTAILATWFIAWGTLGHRPRPHIDDPKAIGPSISITHGAALLLLESFPHAVVINIAAPAAFWLANSRQPGCRAAMAAMLIGSFISWFAGVVVVTTCMDDVLTWFAD